ALGDADMVHRRQEDAVAARQRHVTRDTGALGPNGLLGNLDDDVVAFLHHVRNGHVARHAPLAPTFARTAFTLAPVAAAAAASPTPRLTALTCTLALAAAIPAATLAPPPTTATVLFFFFFTPGR